MIFAESINDSQLCYKHIKRENKKLMIKKTNIMAQKGNIGVTTENIFPVIKKFL